MTDNHNRVLKVIENGVITQRQCKTCKEVKNIAEFPKRSSEFFGHRSHCKTCHNEKMRQVNKNSRRNYKNVSSKIFKQYGVTFEHVVKTLVDQHGLCANRGCGKEISLDAPRGASNRANIDHSHATGKFRALLCTVCNLHLGKIENDRNQTLGLLEYIAKYSI